MIGTAAAAENVEVRVPPEQFAILTPQFGISGVQIGRVVEFGMATF
jgi:hypothetical protein